MTAHRHTQIGLDRIIRLNWLEKTAALALARNEPATIKSILQRDLQVHFRSANTEVRGSIDKTITILQRVWVTVPRELEPFRDDGLEFIRRLPPSDHMAVHWGMLMAMYPFWANVARQVGRLLRLQGSVVAAQVQRRMCEQYGERETVSRRARYTLRSFLDWGVLRETESKGIYISGEILSVDKLELITWLTEAALHARMNSSAPFKELLDDPSAFPLKIKSIQADEILVASSRLEFFRHGLDNDLVMLKKTIGNGGGQDRALST